MRKILSAATAILTFAAVMSLLTATARGAADPPPLLTPDPPRLEKRVSDLEKRVKELEATLAQTRERLAGEERSRRVDQELIGIGAIDLETGRLLAERAMAAEAHADAAKVVRDLRRRKPFLFRTPTFAIAPAAIDEQREPVAAVAEASEMARENGDRMAILRYLRLKRGV